MNIKQGVKLTGIKAEIVVALMIAQETARTYNQHYRITVTSVTDGTHSKGSLHYVGQAADIRVNDMPFDVLKYVDSLKLALKENYDVVFEKTHIHIEYQPK